MIAIYSVGHWHSHWGAPGPPYSDRDRFVRFVQNQWGVGDSIKARKTHKITVQQCALCTPSYSEILRELHDNGVDKNNGVILLTLMP